MSHQRRRLRHGRGRATAAVVLGCEQRVGEEEGVILEIYIDDIVVKSDVIEPHLADLCLAFDRMRKYNLKMNPLKCAFAISAEKFLCFIIHEHGIEIDPEKSRKFRFLNVREMCKSSLARSII